MRTFRSFLKWIKFRIQCWKEDEWCDYLVFVLTDEDIKLLVEARKERIRLYRSQLQSCGINIEEEIDK